MTADIALYDRLAALTRAGDAGVVVTVLAAAGSVPRGAGAKMLVERDAVTGSIGGGALEFLAVETARGLIDAGAQGPVLRQVPLGPAVQQCCGGHVALLFEPLDRPRLRLALYGAGHVARALVAKMADLPARIAWIDPRPEEFPALVPDNVTAIVTERPRAAAAAQPAGIHHLIMTHDHALDFDLCADLLARGDAAWIGMIGSATKAARFAARLRATGIDPTRLVCPVGLDAVAGKEPGVIAVAILAQLLALSAPPPPPPADWKAVRALSLLFTGN